MIWTVYPWPIRNMRLRRHRSYLVRRLPICLELRGPLIYV